jgi:hypothetical protein
MIGSEKTHSYHKKSHQEYAQLELELGVLLGMGIQRNNENIYKKH